MSFSLFDTGRSLRRKGQAGLQAPLRREERDLEDVLQQRSTLIPAIRSIAPTQFYDYARQTDVTVITHSEVAFKVCPSGVTQITLRSDR